MPPWKMRPSDSNLRRIRVAAWLLHGRSWHRSRLPWATGDVELKACERGFHIDPEATRLPMGCDPSLGGVRHVSGLRQAGRFFARSPLSGVLNEWYLD